ncbi:MAG: formylmethanofuran dehydrogenase subunit C [Hyphomicrobiales bacterium]|nr:formylmethanofuran dehydrogenase subunit C [Hyphomicrobiales bacterium]MBV9520564.1 formylmethanofuran dehydrogenase subunit C [Hyphomicrobiales bacterium]
MSALVFRLKQAPDRRIDLSGLVPEALQGRSELAIARLPLDGSRDKLKVADVFGLRMGDPMSLRFDGGSERFDLVGAGMATGEIIVDGPVGAQAGRLMRAGTLRIQGDAGPYAASRLAGGRLEIDGNAGERLGAPLAGEMAGMSGGIVIVHGDAGSRAGDRLRRGIVVIEGRSGKDAGSRMIAGTLVLRGEVAGAPGPLMRRGTIVLVDGDCSTLPTFSDCGSHRLVAARLLAFELERLGLRFARKLKRPVRRFAGDMAISGKGEIWIA